MKRLRTSRFYAIWRLGVGGDDRQTPEDQIVRAPVAAVQQRGNRVGRAAGKNEPWPAPELQARLPDAVLDQRSAGMARARDECPVGVASEHRA